MKTAVALTIAGSDSGGGAGVQADLKTFAFNYVHGTSVITCLTAQNTKTVTEVMAVSSDMVKAQFEAVISDIKVDALKTGMLFNEEIISTVADCIKTWGGKNILIDPVMVSRTGAQLIDNEAVEAMKSLLFPQALMLTPNLYEAQLLSGISITSIDDMKQAATKIYDLGVKTVLIKGGAAQGENKGIDVFFDGQDYTVIQIKAVDTLNNHGTGCSLGAAITAHLALGKSLPRAIASAKEYVTTALEYSLEIGSGCGPIGHFFPMIESQYLEFHQN
ncbi:bifunctional hydroxymethylpyrimidine kinase/phosphomethylpyrimidine kinase [Cyanobacterium sp. IPPAS B-1200]|uniref:bifunctional hydroxymethylpyrimidine kinase/phosphomethylpyrimidine kinase n=1 Tax=Cyanobacterium sp. IPPAS B-1200 TaxID=1562720 RepID=UPI0008524D92|nr:bifunctional hydroxymethylpyrimidine kinase/phosphomethylpyrimidine kinase [Cyanobacterium sp. IPPAS B-1200]OEJ79534.1 hydroxymethylpyrimidine/phosphomethylpyrimidine kinase [Cyanobacterium sp. IPPAS B-1200]